VNKNFALFVLIVTSGYLLYERVMEIRGGGVVVQPVIITQSAPVVQPLVQTVVVTQYVESTAIPALPTMTEVGGQKGGRNMPPGAGANP
jgi:hypothetical protein